MLARIAAGDHAGAAELFIDSVAVGPGSWARLPAEQQSILTKNAPTFLDEAQDADAYTINLEALKTFSQPTLLSTGTQSPPMFMAILETLLKSLPNARLTTLPEAGHIPHQTHPELYAKTIATFIHEHQT